MTKFGFRVEPAQVLQHRELGAQQGVGDFLHRGELRAHLVVHDPRDRGVVDARQQAEIIGRQAKLGQPAAQLTVGDNLVHISADKVIWGVVSSVHTDGAAALVMRNMVSGRILRGLKSLNDIDERTLAFRAWINSILVKKGIKVTTLARNVGLSHSTLSRAMTSKDQKINFRADTIGRLVEYGGIAPPAMFTPSEEEQGFSEPEAAVYFGPQERDLRPDQSIWTVNTNILAPMGILQGDRFILDQKVRPRNRDAIVVQLYDHQAGSAETLLRIYADGFAVTPLHLIDDIQRIWLDGQNAAVAGVVVESWRTRAA